MSGINKKKIVRAVMAGLLAALSFFVVAKPLTSTEFHRETIASLDAKKETVMELTAASTAASAAITLIPGDTATPIANKRADLSGWFLIVLCAIYLEKYLVIITGYASWYFLVPIGLGLFVLWLFAKGETAKRILAQWSVKLVVLGLALSLVIPASVKASAVIEDTYRASIQQTIDSATQATEQIEAQAESSNKTGLGILSGLQQGVNKAVSGLESVVNNFMEAIAVMIVTSCVIPVGVLLCFAGIVKTLVGVRIPIPQRLMQSIPEKATANSENL